MPVPVTLTGVEGRLRAEGARLTHAARQGCKRACRLGSAVQARNVTKGVMEIKGEEEL
jgi:hypothetical protein